MSWNLSWSPAAIIPFILVLSFARQKLKEYNSLLNLDVLWMLILMSATCLQASFWSSNFLLIISYTGLGNIIFWSRRIEMKMKLDWTLISWLNLFISLDLSFTLLLWINFCWMLIFWRDNLSLCLKLWSSFR